MSYLGIDLGTSSVKVLAIDQDGHVVAAAAENYPTFQPSQGAAEQSPEEWWQATCRATRIVAGQLAEPVTAIGLSGQMHGSVLIGEQNELLRPAIIWSDTRGAGLAEELTALIGRATLAQLVGTPLAAGFQAVTVRWIREMEPETFARIRTVLLPKDELRRRMTGLIATDPSDAASTGMLDVRTRDWSDEVLAVVGLHKEQLPVLRRSGDLIGELTTGAAQSFGLPDGVPVVTGGADAPLAAIGSGVVDQRSLQATISSGAQVIAMIDRPVVDPQLRLHTFASPLDPTAGEPAWYLMGATMVAGLAVRWLRDNVYRETAPDAFELMTAEAELAKPGAGGLIFAPYLTGERTPHLDPYARGVLLGLTADHGRAEITRAVMEGAIYALRDAFDLILEQAPGERDIVLAGGGARSTLWRQIVADIFDRPVKPSTVADQSAVGAAILAAAWHRNEPAGAIGSRWATFDPLVEPITANVERYVELRPIYSGIYEKHRSDFRMLG